MWGSMIPFFIIILTSEFNKWMLKDEKLPEALKTAEI